MRNKHGDQPSCPIAFWLNSLYLTSDNTRPTEVESLVSGEGKVIKFKICHLVYKLITQFALLFRFLSKSFAIEYFTWTCRFEWSGKVGKSIFFFAEFPYRSDYRTMVTEIERLIYSPVRPIWADSDVGTYIVNCATFDVRRNDAYVKLSIRCNLLLCNNRLWNQWIVKRGQGREGWWSGENMFERDFWHFLLVRGSSIANDFHECFILRFHFSQRTSCRNQIPLNPQQIFRILC